MTRAVTIIALTCFLVVGAAAAAILGRASVPDPRPQTVAQVDQNPVSNREAKKDKLAVATLALASFDPAPSQPDVSAADVTRSLRMAYAAQQSPADIAPPQITSPQAVTPAAMPQAPLAPAAPKVAAKPAHRRRNPMRCSATCRSPASRNA